MTFRKKLECLGASNQLARRERVEASKVGASVSGLF